ncbi:hypothetical protein LPJ59_000152 [Coemansia sp. RSA 2399]|nr:hypothetical protein LPJ59_000152 [Coemansia sp. RSA 2399]KAJ1908195.1 hypothetical protein LPJ81_000271 [Coemansia sp. IMI 209127]
MRTFTSAILPRKRRPTASRGGNEDYPADELRRFDTAGSTTAAEAGEGTLFYRGATVGANEGGATECNGVAASERSRLAEYARRLPVRVPFLGARTDIDELEVWSEQALQEPSVASESVVLERSYGGGLLKRVSSMPGNLSLFRAHLSDPLRHPEFYAAPRYTRNQPLPANDPDSTPMFGYALLALTAVVFVASMYALVVSKFMPYTGLAFVDAVKDDRYFCLLMPITGLSFVLVVFWNWIGMKFFRHN